MYTQTNTSSMNATNTTTDPIHSIVPVIDRTMISPETYFLQTHELVPIIFTVVMIVLLLLTRGGISYHMRRTKRGAKDHDDVQHDVDAVEARAHYTTIEDTVCPEPLRRGGRKDLPKLYIPKSGTF